LTETWGTLPELVPVALCWIFAGVAAAVARAAEAAAIVIAFFMVIVWVIGWLEVENWVSSKLWWWLESGALSECVLQLEYGAIRRSNN
jgi:hypothetical protein